MTSARREETPGSIDQLVKANSDGETHRPVTVPPELRVHFTGARCSFIVHFDCTLSAARQPYCLANLNCCKQVDRIGPPSSRVVPSARRADASRQLNAEITSIGRVVTVWLFSNEQCPPGMKMSAGPADGWDISPGCGRTAGPDEPSELRVQYRPAPPEANAVRAWAYGFDSAGGQLMMYAAKGANASKSVPPTQPVRTRSGEPLPDRWNHPSEQDRRRSEAEQIQTDIAAGR